MKFTGQWHGAPDFSGEGITVCEYNDGRVIGYFFTYTPAGDPIWLMGVGQRVGDEADLAAYAYDGGAMGDVTRLANRNEYDWGKLNLHLTASGDLRIMFMPKPEFMPDYYDGAWAYTVVPLYPQSYVVSDAGLPPVPAPEPSPQPSITLQKFLPNGWSDPMDLPVLGRMHDPDRSKYLLTVTGAPVRVLQAYATGRNSPRIHGISQGTLVPGQYEISFSLMPGWEQGTEGSYEWGAWFKIELEKFGVILETAVQMKPER